MSRLPLALSLLLLATSVTAQIANAPRVKAGDSWVFREITEKGPQGWVAKDEDVSVDHVDATTIFLSIKESGSQQTPTERLFGADWSRVRDVNGSQQVVNRPFVFPLEVGKKWEVKYTEANPNPLHTSETFQIEYRVIGWEDIEVPAGKFRALKIEADGNWSAEVASANKLASQALNTSSGSAILMQNNRVTPHAVSGRLYKAFWYVPSLKNMVKSVEESYSSAGVRSDRASQELLSSKVSS